MAQAHTADQGKEHVIRQLVKRLTVLEARSYHDDEQDYVDDTQRFFNQPHVISAIVLVILGLLWLTWTQSTTSSIADNTKSGIFAAIFFFIIVGMLTFPTSGPFSKPLPILWRAVFAISVIYEVFLLIILFQTKPDARQLMTYLDSNTGHPLIERSYGEACEFTWENIKPNVFDRFALAHFLGWLVKSMIIRDVKLCWIISIGWEFIEILFTPLLPNFAECWWDQWLLDVLICNGLGIFAGVWIQHHFQMMHHNWFEVYSSPIYTAKTQRLLKKYRLSHLITQHGDDNNSNGIDATESFHAEKWGFTRSLKRFFGIQFIILVCQTQELNAFFLKQLLWLPPESYLNPARLCLWMLFSIPCVRQFYLYMTNPHVKTLGRQAFLSIVMMVTELMIIFKFSEGEFTEAYPDHLKRLLAFLTTCYILYNVVSIYLIRTSQPRNDVHRAALKSLDKQLADDADHSFNVFDVMDHINRTGDETNDEDDDCDLYPTSHLIKNQHVHHNKHKKRSEADGDDEITDYNQESSSNSFYNQSVLSTPTKSPTKAEVESNSLIKFTPNSKAPEPPACQPQTSSTSMVNTKDLFVSSGRFNAKKQITSNVTESEQHRHFRMLLKQKRAEEDGSAVPPSPRRNLVRKPIRDDEHTTDDEIHSQLKKHSTTASSSDITGQIITQQQYNDTTGNSSSDAEMDLQGSQPQARTVRGTPRRTKLQRTKTESDSEDDDDDDLGPKRRPSRAHRG